MKTATFLTVAFGAIGLFAASAPAFAQDRDAQEAIDKRFQRIEKDLREVRSIVLQAKATGQPVEVRTASSDDQITTLQTKLDDLDQTVRGLNGQIEVLSHDLDLTKQAAAADQTQSAALTDRLDKLEKQVAALAAPPPPPPAPDASAPTQGAPEAATDAANPADASAAYVKAHKLMLDGDYPGAAQAFQGFLDTYPSSASVPAARYWLGEIKYTESDYNGAAASLVSAIRGWPKTAWAPDAVIKLALSLSQLNKGADACAALGALDRHYPRATAATKARAAAARTKAGCAG